MQEDEALLYTPDYLIFSPNGLSYVLLYSAMSENSAPEAKS